MRIKNRGGGCAPNHMSWSTVTPFGLRGNVIHRWSLVSSDLWLTEVCVGRICINELRVLVVLRCLAFEFEWLVCLMQASIVIICIYAFCSFSTSANWIQWFSTFLTNEEISTDINFWCNFLFLPKLVILTFTFVKCKCTWFVQLFVIMIFRKNKSIFLTVSNFSGISTW